MTHNDYPFFRILFLRLLFKQIQMDELLFIRYDMYEFVGFNLPL